MKGDKCTYVCSLPGEPCEQRSHAVPPRAAYQTGMPRICGVSRGEKVG